MATPRAGAEGEAVNLLGWLSEMEYPHWMMVAGAVLLVVGFIGFAFSQNKNGATVDERAHEAGLRAKGIMRAPIR